MIIFIYKKLYIRGIILIKKQGISLNTFSLLFILASAHVAYSAGSGFGTGQEMMQFFTSYGYAGLVGVVVSLGLATVFDVIVITDTRKFNLQSLHSVFTHYTGKTVGKILIAFSFAYLFGMAALMISGAGAAFHEYFGVGPIVGRVIMSSAIFITVIFGLRRTVNVLGTLGPIIGVFIAIIGIITLVSPETGLVAGNEYLKVTEGATMKPAPNWLIAAFMYFSFATLFRIPYMNGISNKDDTPVKTLVWGNIIGSIIFIIIALIMVASQIANISILGEVEVPNLAMGVLANPALGALFGGVLVIAIYTTAVPLIWSVSDVISKESDKKYPWIITFAVILAFLLSGVATFSMLVNILASAAAYVGALFFIPAIYVRFIKKPKAPETK